MKLVFTAAEVAEALQISTEDFRRHRPGLEASGFPSPLPDLEDRWSIMDVVNWVNGNQRIRGEHGHICPGPRLS